MPYNLLLLPLLGGYLFLRWWNPTRYHALRAEKERLLILAAIPGLVSLIVAFAIVKGLGALFPCSAWPNFPCFPAWWKLNVPFDYLGTSLLAFALGASIWKPWNALFCDQNVALDRVIEEDKIPFESLLKKAQDQAKTVSVTMSNGKVYIGWVTHSFNPALPTRFIQILPSKSGYRDEQTKRLVITTFYLEALNKLQQDIDDTYRDYGLTLTEFDEVNAQNEKKKTPAKDARLRELSEQIDQLEKQIEELEITADDFNIVLPVTEIMSINIFSEYVYSKYFAPAAEDDEDQDRDKIEPPTMDVEQQQLIKTMQRQIEYFRSLSPAENEELFRKLWGRKAPSSEEEQPSSEKSGEPDT